MYISTEEPRNGETKKQEPQFGSLVFSFFRQSRSCGFTLIELLVVMAILSILFALVLVAVNPVRQTQQANNAQRRSDANAILNAVYQYAVDEATFPTGISTSFKVIGTSGSGCSGTCGAYTPTDSCFDLSADVVPLYLASMPFDPESGSSGITRYAIKKSSTDPNLTRITVLSCDADLSATIEVTR